MSSDWLRFSGLERVKSILTAKVSHISVEFGVRINLKLKVSRQKASLALANQQPRFY